MFDVFDSLQESLKYQPFEFPFRSMTLSSLVEPFCQEKEKDSLEFFSAITRTISLQATCDRKDDTVCILATRQSAKVSMLR